MADTFTNKPFLWQKQGTDPTMTEAQLGFQGGMALPASYVNQMWTRTYNAINEIQQKIDNGQAFTDIFCTDFSMGSQNTKSGSVQGYDWSMSIGTNNTIGPRSYIFGSGNTVGLNSFVFGGQNEVTNDGTDLAVAMGNNLLANRGNYVIGDYNKQPVGSDGADGGDTFVIGNGTSATRSNSFRVTRAGQCMGTTFFASSGADYAELFEWLDGNPDGEDRRGLFVTLDGEKIRLATAEDDYILGAISATPTVIGDAASEDWHGKYERDIFGARIFENGTYKLSEAFNKELDNNYTSRLKRAEWGIVGLTGKLVLVDDGTCQVNGYCYPGKSGVATASEKGYRVMSRIDDTHIRVLIK